VGGYGKNGDVNGTNAGGKGESHDFWGRQNCNPSWASITYVRHWSQSWWSPYTGSVAEANEIFYSAYTTEGHGTQYFSDSPTEADQW